MRRKVLLMTLSAGAIALVAGVTLSTTLSRAKPAAAVDRPSAASLPLTHVHLFNSGVGFFQRQGEVVGDARVDLTFPVQDVNDLLKVKPNDAPLIALRAINDAGLKQFGDAMTDAERAIALDPNNAMAYLGRGIAKAGTGKAQDALADYDRSITLNPKDTLAFAERGLAYVSLNQTDKALLDFDQALALSPTNMLAKSWRGLALMLKGRTGNL